MTTPATPPADQETNEQKLHRHLERILHDIHACLHEEDDARRDEMREELEPLCVMKQIEYHVQITWGGPGYRFKLMRDPESREFMSGTFYYADWFTYDDWDLLLRMATTRDLLALPVVAETYSTSAPNRLTGSAGFDSAFHQVRRKHGLPGDAHGATGATDR